MLCNNYIHTLYSYYLSFQIGSIRNMSLKYINETGVENECVHFKIIPMYGLISFLLFKSIYTST